ncbi:RING/U-box superfamily protein isoform 1 [Dorcoceras hygrometricum]|uniref:RING/U-box superfamily protein isoform 1 n=1 Tax=Dorcoceras hygrometricum TaxID=472368 RepID=A0A2Z7AMF2_9LAMI|nr:RING/U-box superfamily protein isoform 1 [Dorcoceras hygrometricum]
MISSGINLVMTVIGFAVSTLFIVFVCTRLIWARIQLSVSRRSFSRALRSDNSTLEHGLHGLEPMVVSNFPTKKYRDLCFSSKENTQCIVCLSEYLDEDTLCILPLCGHSFHATCIDIWLHRHFTCPVCRISLRELPERRWCMQPMFSSAVRSHYTMQSINSHYCHCMLSGQLRSSRSHENQVMDTIEEAHCDNEGVQANARASDQGAIDRKLGSPSDQCS